MSKKKLLSAKRIGLLNEIKKTTELPISILGFVWLVLLIVEMARGLSPLFENISLIIWGIFILDFILCFIIAPNKITFLKKEWLLAISLFVPAVRFVRFFRFVRFLQGGRIITMIGSIHRSMHSLNVTLKRRGFAFVMVLTIAVILLGAAGIYSFEKNQPDSFTSYPDAIYWTTMLLITIGSDYWAQTPAGKILTLLISLYGVTVLGYLTAMIVSFFVETDVEKQEEKNDDVGANDIAELRKEIRELSSKIDQLNNGKEIK